MTTTTHITEFDQRKTIVEGLGEFIVQEEPEERYALFTREEWKGFRTACHEADAWGRIEYCGLRTHYRLSQEQMREAQPG